MGKSVKHLKLKFPSWVFIDWANVYNWKKSFKREVDPRKLYKYLKGYKEIEEIHFYFGRDRHRKSKTFLRDMRKVGYKITTKSVKYILVTQIDDQKIYRRKCDFDMEMCIDVHKALAKGVESFIFFTGDGDFEPLYRLLHNKGKQVIVIYASNHVGREILKLEREIFLFNIKKLLRSNSA